MTASELTAALRILVDEWAKGEAVRTLLALTAVAERHTMPQIELTASLGVGYTAATVLVKRLTAAGLVRADIDPAHRSYRLLTLTEAGAALLRRAGVTV